MGRPSLRSSLQLLVRAQRTLFSPNHSAIPVILQPQQEALSLLKGEALEDVPQVSLFWRTGLQRKAPGAPLLAGDRTFGVALKECASVLVSAQVHTSARALSALPEMSEPDMDSPSAEQRSPPTQRVCRLVDEIAELTLLEVADLTKLLKRKLGMPDIPMGGMMMPMGMAPGMMPGMMAGGAPAAAAAPEEPPKEEKTSFDVKLQKFDAASKLKVIKEVRAITGLGLKESKELVESAPAVVKKGVTKDEAESIMGKLTAVGGEVELE